MGDTEDKKPDVGEAINLKVVTQDGNEIFFKARAAARAQHCADALSRSDSRAAQCKPATQLSKLMNAFCQRQGVAANTVRFLFDGNRLRETQTPKEVSRSHRRASRSAPIATAARCRVARLSSARLFSLHPRVHTLSLHATVGHGGW